MSTARFVHRMSSTAATLTCAALLAAAGCSAPDDAASGDCTAQPTPELALAEKGLAGPPIAKASVDGCSILVGAFEYGWGLASGGAHVGRPPSVGTADTVDVKFPAAVTFLSMTSRLVDADGGCSGPAFDGVVTRTGPDEFELAPGGPAGLHRVVVAMKSEEGSAKYAFDWDTTQRGPIRDPLIQARAVPDPNGRVDLNGQFMIQNIADVTAALSATTDITSADGKSEHVESMLGSQPADCLHDPTIYLIRTAAPPGSHPGAGPYTYDVALTIGETVHRASATWAIGDPSEFTLEFTPPLPRPR